jgi:hypothetical protein
VKESKYESSKQERGRAENERKRLKKSLPLRKNERE